ncbi:hypothetical protein [Marinicella meishanensis]|uniref:hypothetical protein n=1 Tax=Marinicella meishanensis TaxID=2873263 RepID=UPI001CBD0887|nr:hypothetical protein [Marinicella sp. NBU2979]
MTTQSKSVLVPFLIVAGLLFVAALGWKFMAGDGDETTAKSATVSADLQPVDEVKPTEQLVAEPTVTVVQPEVDREALQAMTQQEKEAAMAEARMHMSMAMRYQTADKALEALERFHNDGNLEMVRNIVGFMGKAYPNTAIPAKFLDQ